MNLISLKMLNLFLKKQKELWRKLFLENIMGDITYLLEIDIMGCIAIKMNLVTLNLLNQLVITYQKMWYLKEQQFIIMKSQMKLL